MFDIILVKIIRPINTNKFLYIDIFWGFLENLCTVTNLDQSLNDKLRLFLLSVPVLKQKLTPLKNLWNVSVNNSKLANLTEKTKDYKRKKIGRTERTGRTETSDKR